MNNIDIETFYKRIGNSIKITCSYIGNKNFEQVIKSCRLKPLSIFSLVNFKPGELEYSWADEFGNVIKLENNKISPKLEQTSLYTTISTDLFYGLGIIETMEISKSVAIFNDYLLFYGQDEYFRCFNIFDKFRVSPLMVDISYIIKVIENKNMKFKNIDDECSYYSLDNKEIKNMIEEEYK